MPVKHSVKTREFGIKEGIEFAAFLKRKTYKTRKAR